MRKIVNHKPDQECAFCGLPIGFEDFCIQSGVRWNIKWHIRCSPEKREQRFGKNNDQYAKDILIEERKQMIERYKGKT